MKHRYFLRKRKPSSTPGIFRSQGTMEPGIFFPAMRTSLGSRIPLWIPHQCLYFTMDLACKSAALPRTPSALGSDAIISTTPSPSCLATPRSERTADSRLLEMNLSSESSSIIRTVSTMVPVVNRAVLPILEAGISIVSRNTLFSLTPNQFCASALSTARFAIEAWIFPYIRILD